MKKSEARELGHLRKAMDQRNAQWLDNNYGDVADAVRLELSNGATPDDVRQFAYSISGDADWFALKVASAARHIESVQARR